MKKDTEVKVYMQERHKGRSQRLAAARAGMSERTARRYERAGKLPSQLNRPHTWRTRKDPFEEDWPWVVEQLERDPALQGATLFALVCARQPGRYRPTQVRTLQRHIAAWRALHGPEREVIFAQAHTPGERGQSDFTWMKDMAITLAGEPFPHRLFHFVLTYSNVEAVSICQSESFEALAEGLEHALWQIGGVPAQHRTDQSPRGRPSAPQRGARGVERTLSGAHGPLRDAADLEQYGRRPRKRRCGAGPSSLQRGRGPGAAGAGEPRFS